MKNNFGNTLKELRIEKGLSQYQLAKEVDNKVTHSAIASWEKVMRIPNFDVVIMFAYYFNVSTDYFADVKN